MKQYAWCKLKDGNSNLAAYLEFSSKLKVGIKVTLKNSDDPKLWWTVVSVGEPKDAGLIESKGDWYETDFNRKDGKLVSKQWS